MIVIITVILCLRLGHIMGIEFYENDPIASGVAYMIGFSLGVLMGITLTAVLLSVMGVIISLI